MRRRARWLLVAAVALSLAAAALVLGPAAPGEASAVGRGGRGLVLARRYLAARGTPTPLLTTALHHPLELKGTLLMAFPASGTRPRPELLAAARWVRGGGTLVLLYGGGSRWEADVLELFQVRVKGIPPLEELNPVRWWREAGKPWALTGPGLEQPALLTRPRNCLLPGKEDTRLLEDGEGRTFGLSRPYGRGLLVVLPAEVLANQRLLHGGNADLLEFLRRRLPAPVHFDELIHGLGTVPQAAREGTPMADALLAQILLLYLATLLALGWRMGPSWPEERPSGGAVSGLLLRLGAAHRRMGHHADAARAMVLRAARLHGWDTPPQDLLEAAGSARGRRLVALAARLARLQADSPRRR